MPHEQDESLEEPINKDVLGDFIRRAELDTVPMNVFEELDKYSRQSVNSLATLAALGSVGAEGPMHEQHMNIYRQVKDFTAELTMAAHDRQRWLIEKLEHSTDPVERLEAETELNQRFKGWQDISKESSSE